MKELTEKRKELLSIFRNAYCYGREEKTLKCSQNTYDELLKMGLDPINIKEDTLHQKAVGNNFFLILDNNVADGLIRFESCVGEKELFEYNLKTHKVIKWISYKGEEFPLSFYHF